MEEKKKTNIRKYFKFCSTGRALTVVIPESQQASYGLYTWPCAAVLASYIFCNFEEFSAKSVLEIGAGTCLPGIVAAKLGADVTVSDSIRLSQCLDLCRHNIHANELQDKVSVVGLTWGLFHSELFALKKLDYIIGSDCFFDPEVCEKILVTVSYLLEQNPKAKFIFSYQERSSDWTIKPLLLKWGLNCKVINTEHIDENCLENFSEYLGGHVINLYEISKAW